MISSDTFILDNKYKYQINVHIKKKSLELVSFTFFGFSLHYSIFKSEIPFIYLIVYSVCGVNI